MPLDARWYIVPGVDVDLAMLNDLACDEPYPSRAAYPFKPCTGEIDFCFRDPRPEVQALWRLIDQTRPAAVVSLHDAAHWTGYEPSYVITNPCPDPRLQGAVEQILFPSGMPANHECAVKLEIPEGMDDNALAKAYERLCPNSLTVLVEINGVDGQVLTGYRATEIDPAHYRSWSVEIRTTLGALSNFSGHPYQDILSTRYRVLYERLNELAAKLVHTPTTVPAVELLNLHASLLTFSYLARLANKLDPGVPGLRTPPEAREVLPKPFGTVPILLDYDTLAARQLETIVRTVELHLCRSAIRRSFTS